MRRARTLVVATLVALSIYVMVSELKLIWKQLNGINSLNTTGQIIPLALEALSILRSLYVDCSKFRKAKRFGLTEIDRKLIRACSKAMALENCCDD